MVNGITRRQALTVGAAVALSPLAVSAAPAVPGATESEWDAHVTLLIWLDQHGRARPGSVSTLEDALHWCTRAGEHVKLTRVWYSHDMRLIAEREEGVFDVRPYRAGYSDWSTRKGAEYTEWIGRQQVAAEKVAA